MFTQEQANELIKNALNKAYEIFKEKKFDIASILLEQIVKIDKDYYEAIHLLGMTYHQQKKYDEAINCYEKIYQFNPSDFENLNNMALSYGEKGNFEKSILFLNKAIEINPKIDYLYTNLGIQYKNKGDLQTAIDCFKKVKSKTEVYWSNIGGCYGELNMLDDAEYCFNRSLEINPSYAPSHTDLANIFFHKKIWKKAWEEYEWRYDSYSQLDVWKNLYDQNKKWNGESLENKKIIIHCEQGSGDNIQFSRYLSFLKNAHVTFHGSKDLSPLFENLVDEIICIDPIDLKKEDLPHYDYQCSLLSLPHVLKLDFIPDPIINYKQKMDLVQYASNLKIGLSWAGNPQHPNDPQRSIFLKNFQPICELPNVKLFSLVKDLRKRCYRFSETPIDLTENAEKIKIINMADYLQDFGKTASLINSLDIVISVDTSVLHLAGSLNKKTFALIPNNPDWRWGLSEHQSPWYKSIEIFRQDFDKKWKSAIEQICKKIQKEYPDYN